MLYFKNQINPYKIKGVTLEEKDYHTGRSKWIKRIQRFAQSKFPDTLAIIGELAIGKKSLIHNAFFTEYSKGNKSLATQLTSHNIFIVKVNISNIPKGMPSEFFIFLISRCLKEIEASSKLERGDLLKLERLYKDIKENKDEFWSDFLYLVKKFLIFLKDKKYHINFILIKFDAVKDLFKNQIYLYQSFRELLDDPSCRMSYIILSRRKISMIEEQSGSISDLQSLFPTTIYLKPFTGDEIDSHLELMKKINVDLSLEQKNKIIYYCGGYPHLLNVLCSRIIDIFYEEEGQINIEQAFQEVEGHFKRHYKKLLELLEEDKRYDAMNKLLLDRKPKVSNWDKDELLRYGLIKKDNGIYTAFSQHFQEFLENIG